MVEKIDKNIKNNLVKFKEKMDAILERVLMITNGSKRINIREIEPVIVLVAGMDKRTIRRYIELLIMFGYLKKINKHTFDVIKVPSLYHNTPLTQFINNTENQMIGGEK